MIRPFLAALSCLATQALADCGPTPGACSTENGEYHAAPVEADNAPAVIFLHGAGSNGANTMRNTGLVNALNARGYAVIAPTGALSFGENGSSWNFFPTWDGRDETEFLKEVARDAETRFGIDPEKILLAGFSAGGFQVTYTACEAPGTFAAYAPVSGGFWRPQPQNCAGPVRLFQTHGWRDTVVPLEGRSLRAGQFIQGDIFAGLELWRLTNACDGHDPTGYSDTGEFQRRRWEDCAPGSALEFALFPGGHMVPPGWSDMIADWFESLPE